MKPFGRVEKEYNVTTPDLNEFHKIPNKIKGSVVALS